ncbi:DUF6493 family protein [Actinomadura parmotrematis]|uniref:Secreted protein n=1 Tax=Actinomadura parmotrematis TaxID=2864039 RepID=A0ABS7FQ35_9ACTN|nr:DUF6493 family protein [Actinomadura parmotrematis]MBW8482503.1 hypothetical protein [Actinomadura parmotrematis]
MSLWDEIRAAVARGDAQRAGAAIRAASPAERKAAGAELAPFLRGLAREGVFDEAAPLHVAGAACLPGAAAVAQWVTRREIRFRSGGRPLELHTALILELLADRPVEWRADVAARIAARLRPADLLNWRGDGLKPTWHLAAALVRDTGAPAPADEGFVLGWAAFTDPRHLAGDPFREAMLPLLFEHESVGRLLEGDMVWHRALTHRSRRADRALLVDGCVSRFLRGGEPRDLRWFTRLFEALAMTPDEAAARARDLVAVLPGAPGPVVDLVLPLVRGVPGLDDAAFTGAAEGVLFRSEKKIVRAGLAWVAKEARTRPDAALTALTAAFRQDSLDLLDRAVAIAEQHAEAASPETRRAVRDAATALPAAFRDRIAAAFGAVEAGPEAPAALPAWAPPGPFPVIGSLAELEEAMDGVPHWAPAVADQERLFDGLVRFAYEHPEEVGKLVNRVTADTGNWLGGVLTGVRYRTHLPLPPLSEFWQRRVAELPWLVGRVPVLLATPTSVTGHVDPDVLAERLARYEAAGLEPGPADLEGALLRRPRTAPGVPGDPVFRVPPGSHLPELVTAVPEGGLPFTAPPRGPDEVDDDGDMEGWHLLVPSHREIAAAHLVPWMKEYAETWVFDVHFGEVLLTLADADGPVGPAMAAALARGLVFDRREARAHATSALIVLASRGQLDGTLLGTALAGLPEPRPNRVAPCLADLAAAGAPGEAFAAITTMLPALWPAPGTRAAAGLPDLIALATTTAVPGTPVPGLAEVAARGGSSRLVREAARLQEALA